MVFWTTLYVTSHSAFCINPKKIDSAKFGDRKLAKMLDAFCVLRFLAYPYTEDEACNGDRGIYH